MSNYLLYIYQNKKLISICFLLLFAAMPILAQPAGRILFNSDFEIPILTPASPSPPRQGCSSATSCWYLTPESTVPGWKTVAISIPTTTGTYFITIFYNETAIRRKIVVQ